VYLESQSELEHFQFMSLHSLRTQNSVCIRRV
jgi:hypothetical protein